MANTTNSAYMSLPIPIPGQDAGPQYAIDVNSCLTIVDQHNHSPGSGVQITPSGLNINSDLPMNGSNLTLTRTVRFQAQGSPITATAPDLGCLSVAGVDLYYNDLSGNSIRLTQSGSVAGTSGSIGGLVPPASVVYSSISKTFTFNSLATTRGNLDVASVTLRNLTAGSSGLTLQAPTLGSDYSITLPQLPASVSIATIDASGIMGTWAVDNSTIDVNSSTLRVKPSGITNVQIASQTVLQSNLAPRATGTTVGAGGVAISTGSGLYTNTGPGHDTPVSCTITTTGRPVFIGLMGDPANPSTNISVFGTGSTAANFDIYRDAAKISGYGMENSTSGAVLQIPPGAVFFVDTPTAGTYTYSLQTYLGAAVGVTMAVTNCSLIAYEL